MQMALAMMIGRRQDTLVIANNQRIWKCSSESSGAEGRLNEQRLTISLSDNDPKSYRNDFIWRLIITIAASVAIGQEIQVHRQEPCVQC